MAIVHLLELLRSHGGEWVFVEGGRGDVSVEVGVGPYDCLVGYAFNELYRVL